MEKEKRNKNNSVFIIFLVIIVMFIVIYIYTEKVNYEKEILKENISELQNNIETAKETAINNVDDIKTDNSEKNILDLGKYEINGDVVDPSDGNGIANITLENNNQFTIDLAYGSSYVGEYKIENDILICSATREDIYEGGENPLVRNSDCVFEFKIIDNITIEFISPEVGYELNIGKTYSISNENT